MLQFSKKVAAMFFFRVSSRRHIAVIALILLATGLTVWAQTPPPKHKKHHKAKPAQKAQPEQAAIPTPPPTPPTPEQMPPRPPTVSYQNGQLSIVAPNSTLSDILRAVKSKTGAAIDIPPGANERVISRFGPGPARDVLAALLNGSHFNYVMIGSDANPASVAQVILTPRTGGETPPSNQAGGPLSSPGAQEYSGQMMRPQPYPGGPGAYQTAPGSAPPPEEAPAAESEEDDSAAQQDNGDGTDQGAPEQVNQGGGDGQENAPPQVKTPEQLLQELQRQQQIQQQQQQGQPQPPAPPQ